MGKPTERTARLMAGALVAIALVGVIDGQSSAYVAFSIFYILPIAGVSWAIGRTAGVVAAVASVAAGFAADLLTIHAPIGFAVWNIGNRALMFGAIAVLVSRLRTALEREHELVERERELNDVKSELMRRVAEDSREPLGEMYAKLVNVAFDADSMTNEEIRAMLAEAANASTRLSSLMTTLSENPRTTSPVGSTPSR
jgi:signal transduction histidine kinase